MISETLFITAAVFNASNDKVKLFKLALKYDLLWDIANGIALLRDEHLELHYGSEADDDED